MYFILAAVLAVAPVDSSCEECKRFTQSCVSGAKVNTSTTKTRTINRERFRKVRIRKGGCCG